MLRALVIAMVASVLVYGALIVASDGPTVAEALTGFSPLVVLAMLVLSLGGYLLRAYRWGLLMRTVGHPVRLRDALYLHLSGQTMGISPGRVGEVLKPLLSRQVGGLPMSKGLPLVFTERVADLIAVCILALGGLSALGGGVWMLALALAAIVVGAAVASSEWFHRLALHVLERQGWMQRHREAASSVSDTIRSTLSWRVLWWSTTFSVAAWGLEGIGFALCLRELGFTGLDLAAQVSVYAVAAIIGAFTFLPAGIGFTEASMAGILVAAGMAASRASAATLITRVMTLWWAVLIGWLVLVSRPALFRQLFRASGYPDREGLEVDV